MKVAAWKSEKDVTDRASNFARLEHTMTCTTHEYLTKAHPLNCNVMADAAAVGVTMVAVKLHGD